MRYGRYGTAYLLLRLGLGVTFLWIGIDMFRHPDTWIGFLPQIVPFGLPRGTALQFAALFDVALGLLFLTDNFPRITAWLASLHLIGILITQRIDAVVVRDIGLLGMSLSLAFWPHRRRQRWWNKLFRFPWPFRRGGADE